MAVFRADALAALILGYNFLGVVILHVTEPDVLLAPIAFLYNKAVSGICESLKPDEEIQTSIASSLINAPFMPTPALSCTYIIKSGTSDPLT